MIDNAKGQVAAANPTQKKAYKTPEVVTYGTVAELTAASINAGIVTDGPFINAKAS